MPPRSATAVNTAPPAGTRTAFRSAGISCCPHPRYRTGKPHPARHANHLTDPHSFMDDLFYIVGKRGFWRRGSRPMLLTQPAHPADREAPSVTAAATNRGDPVRYARLLPHMSDGMS
jgi:hypothetical protein